MPEAPITIRPMSARELSAIAVAWAADEGWNPGLHDAPCFHAADPEGFLLGLRGQEPVATISVVRYGAAFGFLGFYIVKPEYRGRGYGLEIWRAGLAHLEGRTVGLDGVVAQQDNYRKSGFELAHNNVRYQGGGGGAPLEDPEIVLLSELPLADILAYDRPFFPQERARFLECWLRQPQSAALGILRHGALAGYGVVRTCGRGHKIGPLFADSPELAERLFLALRAQTGAGEPLFLDVPQTNPAAVALAQRHGMTPVFSTARMYRGARPELPMPRIFGITTFELG